MSWSVSQAKARLSEVIAKARRAPQVIENRGEEVAVVVSKAEYDRLESGAAGQQPTAVAKWLERTRRLRAQGDMALELPARRVRRDRPVPFADD